MIRKSVVIAVFFGLVISLDAQTQPLTKSEAIAHCQSSVADKKPAQISASLQQDVQDYELLVEKSLTYRSETIRSFNELVNKLDRGLPLSGGDLHYLTDGMIAHLDLRDDLYGVVNRYRCWPDLGRKKIDKEIQLQGAMLALSATLMLYDNYLLAISLFEEDHKLRRYLNEAHPGYKLAQANLREVTKQYNDIGNRAEVRKGIKFFNRQWAATSADFQNNDDIAYLYLLIMQSPSYNATLKFSPLYVLNRHGKFFTGYTSDALNELKSNGTNLFSMAFGNSMGLVQTRTGLLYHDEVVEQTVSQSLQAGDILLEKTPFRLTDKFIPGYWGHVAIWVGNEQELKTLGIWDHEVVQPFHEDIRAGNHIVEALRSGVAINPLEHFLNIDDLAVLRRSQHSDDEKRDVIIKALRQVGKPYDFNFDIETSDKIVCSELIYVTYTDIEWPTDKTLGRYTISPTNVAEKSGGAGMPFSVVSLYLEGKPVTNNIEQSFLNLN